MHEQRILPKFFKFLLNSNTKPLDLTKQGRLFQTSVPLECTKSTPHTVDSTDGNDRVDPLLRLHDKFL